MRVAASSSIVALVTFVAFGAMAPGASAASSVTNVTVDNSTPTTAAGGQTTYSIGFTTSASGALSGAAADHIDFVFPAGTAFHLIATSSVKVGTTIVAFCGEVGATLTVTCPLNNNGSIAGGTAAVATLNGVVNPSPAQSYKLSMSTSKDTASVQSPSYTVAAAGSVSAVTVDNTSPTKAAGGQTTYVIDFTTSATGGLSGAAGSKVTLVFPTGTSFQLIGTSALKVGATIVAFCGEVGTTLTVSCQLNGNGTVAANTTVVATLNGVVNPSPPGSYQLTVSTSSDTPAVPSSSYNVATAHPVSGVTVDDTTPTTSANGLTTYVIGLTTSATGGLSGAAGSKLTFVFPTGTKFHLVGTSAVRVGTTLIAFCGEVATSLTVSCPLNGNGTAAASTALTATLNGVINPATAGSYKLSASTTSDPSAVQSPSYSVTSVTGVAKSAVSPSSTVTSATAVTYTVSFKATTALAGDTGSSVSIVFPAAAGIGSLASSPLNDGATTVAFCARFATTATVVCNLNSTKVVHAGDTLTATINGVTNPSVTKQYSIVVSTSSDTQSKSVPFCIAAAGVPCITKFTPASGRVDDTVTITGLNLGGASAVKFNGTSAVIGSDTAKKITTTVPTGATTGTISVTTGGGTATSTKSFTVLP